LSVYSVHTTYLAFRHGSQMHVRRGSSGRGIRVTAPRQQGLFDEQEAV
jgi:hypothetical protein